MAASARPRPWPSSSNAALRLTLTGAPSTSGPTPIPKPISWSCGSAGSRSSQRRWALRSRGKSSSRRRAMTLRELIGQLLLRGPDADVTLPVDLVVEGQSAPLQEVHVSPYRIALRGWHAPAQDEESDAEFPFIRIPREGGRYKPVELPSMTDAELDSLDELMARKMRENPLLAWGWAKELARWIRD